MTFRDGVEADVDHIFLGGLARKIVYEGREIPAIDGELIDRERRNGRELAETVTLLVRPKDVPEPEAADEVRFGGRILRVERFVIEGALVRLELVGNEAPVWS
ncbi:hypothetical protein KAR29_04785 [Aminithiophilus ramosus]|uniref:Uncharacterized protein n=1 Tax=Aminithiophilus ramosus TaxID=3029084 RepID=A0A9Q7AHS5_9BACT|nr:hypothetical protein [Aminithiophilus ramosus]QTX33214.1 hypothetical protein KAR29_04785 [Aminithiophilus ramosus]